VWKVWAGPHCGNGSADGLEKSLE